MTVGTIGTLGPMGSRILMCAAVTLLELPGIGIRFQPFGGIVDAKQRRALLCGYSLFLLFNFIAYFWVGQSGQLSILLYKWGQMVGGAALTLVNLAVIRGRVKEQLFTAGLSAVWTLLLFTITMYAQHMIVDLNVPAQITLNSLVLTVALCGCYPLIRRQLAQTVTPFLFVDSQRYWDNLWFVPYAMYLACYLAVPEVAYPTEIRLVLSRLFMCLAIFFVCRSVADDYATLREKQEISEQLGRQKEYYAALADKMYETRRTRHDFKHHLAAILGFLDEDKPGDAHAYCAELLQRQTDARTVPYSGNAAVDGVLYHYATLAEQQGIDFAVKGSFKSTKVEDLDLCVLLGNALDNAVAACGHVRENPFIKLSVQVDGNVMAITVANSFDGIVQKENGVFLSRKRANAPGIGLRSIRSVCQKYGGNLQIRHDGSVFYSMVLLDLGK